MSKTETGTPAETAPEPSIEAILASIRRIITEDTEREAAGAAARRLPPSGAARSPGPPSSPPASSPPPSSLVTAVPPSLPGGASEAEKAAAAGAPTSPPESGPGDGLASAPPARQVAAEFARLRERLGDHAGAAGPAGMVTPEWLVEALLRPMLREWLDRHLPALVERLVREEIERLSAETRRPPL